MLYVERKATRKFLSLFAVFGALFSFFFLRYPQVSQADPIHRMETAMLPDHFKMSCPLVNPNQSPLPSGTRFGYCITRAFTDSTKTVQDNSDEVLYIAHPAMTLESFYAFTRPLHKAWARVGRKPPVVIVPTYYDDNFMNVGSFKTLERIWNSVFGLFFGTQTKNYLLLPGSPLEGKRGLLDVFINEVIPYVEEREGLAVDSSKRSILGISMGGFNAIQVALSPTSRDKFSRAVIFDAMNFNVNPMDEEALRADISVRFKREGEYTLEELDRLVDSPAKERARKVLERLEEPRKREVRNFILVATHIVGHYLGHGEQAIRYYDENLHSKILASQIDASSPSIYVVTSETDKPFFHANCGLAATLKQTVQASHLPAKVYFTPTTLTHGMGVMFNQEISDSVAQFLTGQRPALHQENFDFGRCQ